ncbi:DNA sulfur modification protein DndE [Geobacter argillaceus]|uniref:DNA sulfur modification protein DndE n=1 Tax=Geobacter argillaceus TaxID=345631 RepID=UPI0011A8720B|nr:DNA sulfur modification protein DndE [Geobacter argillaceus]
MRPPVEHVRVSARSKEILIKIKRRTGLEHWNEICRAALCRSLANPTPPPRMEKSGDSSIDMDWKTFSGPIHNELTAMVILRANRDGVDIRQKEAVAENFRNHLERGIQLMQNVKTINEVVK